MDDSFFRKLTSSEEEEFRQWTRDNFNPAEEPEEIWHPVVRDEWRKLLAAVLDNAMEDHSREGYWRYHRCWKCDNGRKPCPQAGQGGCEYPRARND